MLRESLRGQVTPDTTIGELLQLAEQQKVYTIQPTARVDEAARIWRDHNIGALLVVSDEDHLMGIVTERDGAFKILAENKVPSSVMVGEIMTPISKIISISLGDKALDVVKLFENHGFSFRHAPGVRDGDTYDGIVSEKDLVRYLLAITMDLLEEKSQQSATS